MAFFQFYIFLFLLAAVVWFLTQVDIHFNRRTFLIWFFALGTSSVAGTILLLNQISTQREKTYSDINKKVNVAGLEIHSDTNLAGISDTFEKGMLTMTAHDKSILFGKINFFLHADQTFCENFLQSGDFLSHSLISKLNSLSGVDANEIISIIAQSILSGKKIEDSGIKLQFLPLDNISLITRSKSISRMNKLERCQFLQNTFSGLFNLRPIIENNIYDSITSYFLEN